MLNASPWIRTRVLNGFLGLHNFCYKAISRLALHEEGTHPKHRIMQYHAWFLERIEPESRVIDLGCGEGKMCSRLAEKASEVLGVDISERNIAVARERVQHPAVRFECADITRLPLETMDYDYIILSNVLEHIEDRISLLRAIQPLMQKGARLLLRVPMLDREWVAMFKKERGLEWRLDPTHYTEYTEPQLRQELAQANLRIVDPVRVCFGEIYAVVELDARNE